jgi:iduronate 2-sulfatase
MVFMALVWGGAVAADAPALRPNVLLICVDDLKPLLGCYGATGVKSPNIDRLAARGVLFERAYCNQAVCAPSRNALMTGLRPSTLGIYDLGTNFRLAVPDAVTVAQHFQRNGYRTEAMGKIMHVGHGNTEDAASWSVPHWKPQGGSYALQANIESQREAVAKAKAAGLSVEKVANTAKSVATECADVADTAYGDGMIADEAVRRLDAAKAKPGEPWFIGVGFHKPHLPFNAPKKYWDLYRPESFELPAQRTLPAGAPEFAGQNSGELRSYTDIPKVEPIGDAQARHLIHGYHAAVSFMDAQLGRVLDALDRNGFAENTVIVLWGDHGWHLGDHGIWCKHTNYEQAARQPLIVVAPGVAQAGVKSPALVETVDLYPTLCELAGLPVPQGLGRGELRGGAQVAGSRRPKRRCSTFTLAASAWAAPSAPGATALWSGRRSASRPTRRCWSSTITRPTLRKPGTSPPNGPRWLRSSARCWRGSPRPSRSSARTSRRKPRRLPKRPSRTARRCSRAATRTRTAS